jgi:hypothetical protein
MDRADAPAVDRPGFLGHLIVNIAGLHDRLGLIAPTTLWVQTALNSVLAIAQDLTIASLHSKYPFSWMVLVSSPPSNQAFKGISSLLLSSFDSTHASLGPSPSVPLASSSSSHETIWSKASDACVFGAKQYAHARSQVFVSAIDLGAVQQPTLT